MLVCVCVCAGDSNKNNYYHCVYSMMLFSTYNGLTVMWKLLQIEAVGQTSCYQSGDLVMISV
jgi:hypothetical protein